MQTTVILDKENCGSPADVLESIKDLRSWRENRMTKDLPCGSLDVAIAHLERYHGLLCLIYQAELNQTDEEDS